MKIVHEHIIVKVPTIFLDETKYKGANGMNLMVDVLDNPERHVRNFGEVVSVPVTLPRVPIAQDHTSLPKYHDYQKFNYKTANEIERDIKIGSRVYFHYNSILPDMGKAKFNHFYLFSKVEPKDGKEGAEMIPYHYFRVKYELCYATVEYAPANAGTSPWKWWMESEVTEFKPDVPVEDDLNPLPEGHSKLYLHPSGGLYHKKVTMIGSWCLIEPDMETWDDISIPTPQTLNGKPLLDTQGKVVMKPKDQWLVMKARPEGKYLRGWVRFVGKPLMGDNQEVQRGMYVMVRPKTDTILKFEGVDYFRMIQRNILMWEPSKSQLAS